MAFGDKASLTGEAGANGNPPPITKDTTEVTIRLCPICAAFIDENDGFSCGHEHASDLEEAGWEAWDHNPIKVQINLSDPLVHEYLTVHRDIYAKGKRELEEQRAEEDRREQEYQLEREQEEQADEAAALAAARRKLENAGYTVNGETL